MLLPDDTNHGKPLRMCVSQRGDLHSESISLRHTLSAEMPAPPPNSIISVFGELDFPPRASYSVYLCLVLQNKTYIESHMGEPSKVIVLFD